MWVPVTVEDSDDELPPPNPFIPGSSGRPSFEVCTTVPDNPVGRACCTSARSWAGVRGGRLGTALAERPATRATAATSAAAPTGAAHRSAGRSVNRLMTTLCAASAETLL